MVGNEARGRLGEGVMAATHLRLECGMAALRRT